MRKKLEFCKPLFYLWICIFIASATFTLSAEETAVTEKDEQKTENKTDEFSGFVFGSYGRVQPATNLEGGSAYKNNIVSHGSRLEQDSYVEFDLDYIFPRIDDFAKFKFVSTIAFEDIFHDNGQWTIGSAIRNLFIQADDVFIKGLTFWAGSRMYRGDDIYLLDYWPLDDLNTYGGGVGYKFGNSEIDLHIGLNRLDNDYQYSTITVVSNDGVSSEEVVEMDRQRYTASLKLTHNLPNLAGDFGMKIKLYGELHSIGSGKTENKTDNTISNYPSDSGFVAGAEIGAYGFGTNSFANLFIRYGHNLGAYNALSVPQAQNLNMDGTTEGSKEFIVGLAGNWEIWKVGTMFGSYFKYFKDGDPNKYDNDDYSEFMIAVRPHLMLHKHFYLAFEASHQLKRTNGLTPVANGEDRQMTPQITKLSIIPLVTMGGGTYARPQIRLVYTASFLNDDAKHTFNASDERAGESVQHYLGISAEWWFNTLYR